MDSKKLNELRELVEFLKANGIEQFDGSETAIGHRDDLPLRQPARDLQHDLPPPVSELLMSPPVFACISF